MRRNLRLWRDGRFGPMPSPRCWLFIVGCYGSGTSLLHELLAEHPSIGSLPTEGQLLTDQLIVPREVGLPRLWALDARRFRMDENDDGAVDVERLKRQWGARFNHVDRPVLMEKSPTNAARTRWLQKHFTPSCFIAIIRDGQAVAEGIRRRAGCSIGDAARQWARSNEVLHEDLAFLHRRIVVRYEDLAAQPDRVLSELLRFVGLGPHAHRIEGRAVSVHGRTSEIRDMNERARAALSPADRRTILDVAGDQLRLLGYV